jgi:hypothetical protein
MFVSRALRDRPNMTQLDVLALLRCNGLPDASLSLVQKIVHGLGFTKKANGFVHQNKFSEENLRYYGMNRCACPVKTPYADVSSSPCCVLGV